MLRARWRAVGLAAACAWAQGCDAWVGVDACGKQCSKASECGADFTCDNGVCAREDCSLALGVSSGSGHAVSGAHSNAVASSGATASSAALSAVASSSHLTSSVVTSSATSVVTASSLAPESSSVTHTSSLAPNSSTQGASSAISAATSQTSSVSPVSSAAGSLASSTAAVSSSSTPLSSSVTLVSSSSPASSAPGGCIPACALGSLCVNQVCLRCNTADRCGATCEPCRNIPMSVNEAQYYTCNPANPAAALATACVLTPCARTNANCNGVDVDQCETNLGNDALHCGTCGNACANGRSCTNAQCGCTGGATCPTGQACNNNRCECQGGGNPIGCGSATTASGTPLYTCANGPVAKACRHQ